MLKLTAPNTTLAYHLHGRPINQRRVLSAVSVPSLSDSFKLFLSSGGSESARPETDALWFYTLEHLMSEIKKTYHPEQPITNEAHLKVVRKYGECLNMQATRMFYYILMICIREGRHLHGKDKLEKAIVEKWGQGTYDFIKSIDDSASVAQNMLKNNPPDISLEACVDSLVYIFYAKPSNAHWGSSYGGKKWGAIADCLAKLVHGEYTPLLFLDVAYTLAHNTAPIFNKGGVYHNQNESTLLMILDVQRAGMIPQFITEFKEEHAAITEELYDFLQSVKGEFHFDTEYVDWHVVEQFSPNKSSYGWQKQQQVKKYGPSQSEKEIIAKKKAEEAKKKHEEAVFAKGHFEYSPNEYVKKIPRSKTKVAA